MPPKVLYAQKYARNSQISFTPQIADILYMVAKIY